MTKFRTHTCGALTLNEVGLEVHLAGWVHRKRDHGNLLFIDLRDNYGITQCVLDTGSPCFAIMEKIRPESVILVMGKVVRREVSTINPKMPTGEIEVQVQSVEIESMAEVLPIQVVADSSELSEEQRLTYRFLDLRREKPHANILLRNKFIQVLRKQMWDFGFSEFQTPILTSSSPEGARDFLVPSRLHKGQFYALPQAPQQFKQLLMVSGFDKYFQIAPCFRDEDARADRSPGEFYQMDMEMSFVEQQDVFNILEAVIYNTFVQFIPKEQVSPMPFVQIPYFEAMEKYGTDKPDLRNPLVIEDVTDCFKDAGFGLFSSMIKSGSWIRAIKTKKTALNPRSWFDKLGDFAKELGTGGLAYISFTQSEAKGPIAKNLEPERIEMIKKQLNVEIDDTVFFIAGKTEKDAKIAGNIRIHLGQLLGLIKKDSYQFCWIVDFPMFEKNEETGEIEFGHNPFSMPRGGLEALMNESPFDIRANQYDMVLNGLEILSGAVRNHRPDIMYKVFEIAGYPKETVEQKFAGLLNAFKYGAPPHAGGAFGIDRLVMVLTGEDYIREVIAFPLNQQGQDLLMKAPSEVSEKQLRELHIKLR